MYLDPIDIILQEFASKCKKRKVLTSACLPKDDIREGLLQLAFGDHDLFISKTGKKSLVRYIKNDEGIPTLDINSNILYELNIYPHRSKFKNNKKGFFRAYNYAKLFKRFGERCNLHVRLITRKSKRSIKKRMVTVECYFTE